MEKGRGSNVLLPILAREFRSFGKKKSITSIPQLFQRSTSSSVPSLLLR